MDCPSTCTRRSISYLTWTRSRASKKGCVRKAASVTAAAWVFKAPAPRRARAFSSLARTAKRHLLSRQNVAVIMYADRQHTNRFAGVYVAICFVIVHDTPARVLDERVQMRQNGCYISGKIPLTLPGPHPVPLPCAGHRSRALTSATTRRRSAGRNSARPAAIATNGSGAAQSVQLVGIECRRPAVSWHVTRSSPQFWRCARSTNRWPTSG